MPTTSNLSRDELLSAIRAHIQHDHLEQAATTLDRFEPAQAHYYWLPIWQRLNALLEAWPDDEREVPIALCEHQVSRWPTDARDESRWLTPDKLQSLDPRLRLLGQVRINAMHLAQDQLRLEHPEALPHVHALYINGQLQPEQLAKLLSSPLSAQITSLHLEHVPLTQSHIEALISAPLRLRLKSLSSSHNKLSEAAMQCLGSVDWPALRELNLRDGRINDSSLSALFMSENMPALRARPPPERADRPHHA